METKNKRSRIQVNVRNPKRDIIIRIAIPWLREIFCFTLKVTWVDISLRGVRLYTLPNIAGIPPTIGRPSDWNAEAYLLMADDVAHRLCYCELSVATCGRHPERCQYGKMNFQMGMMSQMRGLNWWLSEAWGDWDRENRKWRSWGLVRETKF
jgi:hypothetical protein